MANWRRGEIEAQFNGKPYTLCLTLGALAELEAACGHVDLMTLFERFETAHFTSQDLLNLLAAGLKGGGNPISQEELSRLSMAGGLLGIVKIAKELLAATFQNDFAPSKQEESTLKHKKKHKISHGKSLCSGQ